MSKLLMVLFFCVCCFFLHAQKKDWSVGAGFTYGLPMSEYFTRFYKNGIGGSVQVARKVTNRGSIIGTSTWLKSAAKDSGFKNYTLFMLKLGYESYVGKTNAFVFADGGYAYASNSGISAGVGIGYDIAIHKNSFIRLSPAYHILTNAGQNNWLTLGISYKVRF